LSYLNFKFFFNLIFFSSHFIFIYKNKNRNKKAKKNENLGYDNYIHKYHFARQSNQNI